MVFYPHSQTVDNDINNEICISRIPVDYVTSYLYLGVDIDSMLSLKGTHNQCHDHKTSRNLKLR